MIVKQEEVQPQPGQPNENFCYSLWPVTVPLGLAGGAAKVWLYHLNGEWNLGFEPICEKAEPIGLAAADVTQLFAKAKAEYGVNLPSLETWDSTRLKTAENIIRPLEKTQETTQSQLVSILPDLMGE